MRHVLRRSLVVSTAGLSFVAIAAIAAIPAAMAVPTLKSQLGPTATVIAAGAAVQVRVVYTCPSTDRSPNMSTTVTERVPGGIATGFGSASSNTVTCDGKQHTVQFGLATSNNFPFQSGIAFATGDLSVTLSNSNYTDFSCAGILTVL
jgi:hypothetical protein